jgi:hypothetical protein
MKKDKTAWKSFHKENGPTFALGGGRPSLYLSPLTCRVHGEHEIAREGSTDR